MRTNLSSFLKQQDAELLIPRFVGKLLETNGSAKSGRAAADDANVNFISLAVLLSSIKWFIDLCETPPW